MAIKNAMGNVEQLTPTPPLPSSQEIDNGRMPIFDTGEPDQNFREMYHAHLMAPYLTPRGIERLEGLRPDDLAQDRRPQRPAVGATGV